MSDYFNTITLIGALVRIRVSVTCFSSLSHRKAAICGLFIAILHSLFIYDAHFHLNAPFLHTVAGLLSLTLLLASPARVWWYAGVFIGTVWFWWIGLSFIHYKMSWALPIVIFAIGVIYGILFYLSAFIAEKLAFILHRYVALPQNAVATVLKATALWSMSYIHPFGFDWYKPELIFVESYMGVTKFDFALIVLALSLWHITRRIYWAALFILALNTHQAHILYGSDGNITLVQTRIGVEEKWEKEAFEGYVDGLIGAIDNAIERNASLVVLPESVFPFFLNRNAYYLSLLQKKAESVSIVTGALYLNGEARENAAYFFKRDGTFEVARKTVLVPFGEANPLPDFLSEWVNRVFYDGAVDYVAAKEPTDFIIAGERYRIAICFEATSERLYDPPPKRMIVISNNGWFVPSIEPTLQRLLLQYYHRKYGTRFYHAVNGSAAYIVKS
jgi:apolipoprotein N-acyltransferase